MQLYQRRSNYALQSQGHLFGQGSHGTVEEKIYSNNDDDYGVTIMKIKTDY